MLIEGLDEVGLQPDGYLKEGYEAATGTLTDRSFRTGILMLLKQVANLLLLVFKAHLKKTPGVTNLSSDAGKLTFTVSSRK